MPKRTAVNRWSLSALLLVIVSALILRVLYVRWTEVGNRGHDVWSHVEYIQHIAENWTLPDPHASSVFYHPPLYYLLTAPVYRLSIDAGREADRALIDVQSVSLLLSILTFAAALLAGWIVFGLKKEPLSFILYSAVLASYPALIFFAGRINNDVLYQLIAFTGFLLLLLFWRTTRYGYWYGFWAVLGLGLLTKTHAVLLAPLAIVCMAMLPKTHWKKKVVHAMLGILLMTAIGGWFHAARFFRESNARTTLIGNVEILTNFVENTPRTMLVFNPFQMIAIPYNDPFSDEARRQFFWEYLFRSGLFGEFHFGDFRLPLARTMVIAQLLLIPLGIYAMFRERKRFMRDLPVWGLLALLLSSHAVFRVFFPYSSSQDFRYSILLIIPMAYLAVLGLEKDNPWVKMLRITTALTLSVCSAILVLDLYPR